MVGDGAWPGLWQPLPSAAARNGWEVTGHGQTVGNPQSPVVAGASAHLSEHAPRTRTSDAASDHCLPVAAHAVARCRDSEAHTGTGHIAGQLDHFRSVASTSR